MQQKGCMKTYWTYMLLCADGSFYIGVTNDLEYRINQHKFGFDPKCYTFKRRPVELVYSADFHHIDEAIACEKRLKGWSRAKNGLGRKRLAANQPARAKLLGPLVRAETPLSPFALSIRRRVRVTRERLRHEIM